MDKLFGRQAVVCNRDNCFRAVIGFQPGPAVAKAKREKLEGRQASSATNEAATASCAPSQSLPSSIPACIDTAFILRGSGDRSVYVTVVDKAGQIRNSDSPEKTLVDYY
ncbi:uncharacterized protein LY79DRAFT_665679 [Colletotrichum navitas]|uniref:Uncharacterized protein n=1 Tax=Colletotrichum navitas TaxID=681940 RepID=A0AAD8QDP5_9PEZI|nr:uncharacterized protein LY79DRAFT_665679 [Colletotrichum navitas]KAK1599159.1 hypothetical protein LY79DRAFT_665679 [Colletotrichum navitas]